jgi:hypothetical protein
VEDLGGHRRKAAQIADAQELRRRAFAALREALVRLADRRPLVVFIDDIQGGDQDSAALLESLLRPPASPTLLLIACYRSEEAETNPLLRLILPLRAGAALEKRDIRLEDLSPSDAREMARSLPARMRRKGSGWPPRSRGSPGQSVPHEAGAHAQAGGAPLSADLLGTARPRRWRA